MPVELERFVLLGHAAARYITAWDHWIAFGVLGLLGLHMIWNGFRPDSDDDGQAIRHHGFWGLAATGLGTSIDAMAVGLAVWRLGAGRSVPGEQVQFGAGLRIHRKPGEPVAAGDALFTLYTDTPHRLAGAASELLPSFCQA